MTVAWYSCVAIARPNAACTSRQGRYDAALSGMPGLRFLTIVDMTEPTRHGRQGTANAVGCNHPPGFKSPILRE
jgi:hypothetical protein